MLCLFASSATAGDIDLSTGWENGELNSQLLIESYSINNNSAVEDSDGVRYQSSALHSVSVELASWAREGNYVLKVFGDGRRDQGGDFASRAELSNNLAGLRFSPGEERYYTLSFFAPKSIWDKATSGSTVITQWKQNQGGLPNLEVRLSNLGDYKLTIRSKPHWNSEGAGDLIGFIKPGEWNDMKYYVKHSQGTDGLVKVWLNGELAFERSSRTLYEDNNNQGYVKFGLYTELHDQRTLYFDHLKIQSAINVSENVWSSDQAHLPEISITAPVNNHQAPSSTAITITANASDPAGNKIGTEGGVAKVEFFINDQSVGTDSQMPFAIDWLPPEDGQYLLSAQVTDNEQNQTMSSPVTLQVGARHPQVQLLAPQNLDNLVVDQATIIEADANIDDGNISYVEFFVAGESLGTDTSPPYRISWTPTREGAYLITARAYTDSDKSKEAMVSVSVGAVITEHIIHVAEDASLQQGKPNDTGNWSKVEIKGKTDGAIIGLFKFDLSSILDARYIYHSQLNLYSAVLNSGAVPVSIYTADHSSWNEDSVTWSNGPHRNNDFLSKVVASDVNKTINFNVTAAISDQIKSQNNAISFWAEDTDLLNQAVEFDSRVRTEIPKLIIETGNIALLENSVFPSQPTDLVISNKTDTQLTLSWSSVNDSPEIRGYEIYRNGVLQAETVEAQYQDDDVNADMEYRYVVIAVDNYGNRSPSSTPLVTRLLDNPSFPITISSVVLSNNTFEQNNGEKIVLAFTVTASENNFRLKTVVLSANGQLDETTDVSQVNIYEDKNNDGFYQESELLGSGKYLIDDGQLTVQLNKPLNLTVDPLKILVTYDM